MEQIQTTKSNPHRGWLLITIVAILLLILFVWGWIPRLENTKKIDTLAAANALPRVPVIKLRANKKPIELILPSSAQAFHITPIWARTNGYLTNFLVDIGDVVKEGDLLATIDTPEVDQQLEQGIADLLNSIAQLEIAKITSERWEALWKKNREAVTKQEVDQYNANNKASEALVLSNQKNVARLRYLQQFQNIYAPFDGIIIQRNIDIGSLIYGNINETPQELFQIAKTNIIRFFVQVPQNYFRQIKVGVKAEVTVREFPNNFFRGKVTRFAKALDPTARTLLTEVDVQNPNGILFTGLFGRVKFLMYPDNINFIVPTTAVIIHSGFPQVAVLDAKNVVHLRQVQIGRDYGKEMEVTDGLKEGDRIISIPNDRIVEGAKVDVIQTTEGPTGPPSGTVSPQA